MRDEGRELRARTLIPHPPSLFPRLFDMTKLAKCRRDAGGQRSTNTVAETA
jgi:hypothetical protein